MSDYFISRADAEADPLTAAAFLAERIKSIDGHAESMIAVIPQYIANGNVDLAAELANTIDDPYTRDRLLTAVAEKCAEQDDDEYAMQLADAVEDTGLRSQAYERVGLQYARKAKFDRAFEIADTMAHPDGVFAGIAVRKAVDGIADEAAKTIDRIEHPSAAVTAWFEMAMHWLGLKESEKAIDYLVRARDAAEEIEHNEERARAFCDIGNAFIEAGRNDRAVETFDKAKTTAETIDNMHRDTFLSLAAQGFLHAGSLELADRTLDLVADKTAIASALLGYSREFWRKDDRDEAVESLEEAYAILESQHERETRDHKARFKLFTSIAAQFAGFERGERAIEIAERIQLEDERTSALTQVSGILTIRKEDEEARHAFRAITEDGDRAFALISMSDAKLKNDDRTAAIELLNEADQLAEAVPQLTFRAAAYGEIGRRLYSLGESSSATRTFAAALNAIAQVRDESAKAVSLASIAEMMPEELSTQMGEGLRAVLNPIR